MMSPTSRAVMPTLPPSAAIAIADRRRPMFESLIYVVIAGLLFALPVVVPLVHSSPAAAETAVIVAYADEIDVALAEAEEAARAVDALLAAIGEDCEMDGPGAAQPAAETDANAAAPATGPNKCPATHGPAAE